MTAILGRRPQKRKSRKPVQGRNFYLRRTRKSQFYVFSISHAVIKSALELEGGEKNQREGTRNLIFRHAAVKFTRNFILHISQSIQIIRLKITTQYTIRDLPFLNVFSTLSILILHHFNTYIYTIWRSRNINTYINCMIIKTNHYLFKQKNKILFKNTSFFSTMQKLFQNIEIFKTTI